jgi:crotonobetainyl-CoA:carnitine CoA-transferase CaiB-like acyl-CoA transferase
LSDGPDSRPTPLDDVRVVEISDRIAGSYCGKLLVDAGAEVRKIEPPQGDSLRRFSASGSPIPDGTDSPLFGYLNAGKRSLTWPATEPCSDERYQDELAGADIVVVTATRSQAPQLGIDLRLRLDRSVRRPRRQRVHLAGLGGLNRFPRRPGRTADRNRW